MEPTAKKYAPRDSGRGRKTKAVNIALDPLSRMVLEVAARLSGKSLARYVVDAALHQVKADSRKFNQRLTENGWITVESDDAIERTAKLLLGSSEARSFMRMAFVASNLLNEREIRLFQTIYSKNEFWLRDPKKHLPILPDGSEPKQPVINWTALESQWDALQRPERSATEAGKALLASMSQKKGKKQ